MEMRELAIKCDWCNEERRLEVSPDHDDHVQIKEPTYIVEITSPDSKRENNVTVFDLCPTCHKEMYDNLYDKRYPGKHPAKPKGRMYTLIPGKNKE
jgi:hypothetical protein